MTDPLGTHHDIRIVLEIDGQRYVQSIQPLKAIRDADIAVISDRLTRTVRNAVETHFGTGMTPLF